MKKIILPLVLVVLLLVGGGFLIIRNRNQLKEIGSSSVDQVVQEEQPGEENVFTGSLKSLLGLGRSVKCTWSVEDEGTTMEGTVYVSGQKTRTETRTQNQEMDMTMYFLSDNNIAYSWNKGQTQGYKFGLDDFEDPQDIEEAEADTQIQANQYQEAWNNQYEYQCENWQVDNSIFEVPGNVVFTDMAEQAKQMQQQAEEMKQGMQGMCDALPEPQKTECLKSLE